MGFGGKPFDEKLIYIAKVTREPYHDYYYERKYASRPDCIYREVNGRPERKTTARYHTETDERRRDVGMRFEKAVVLLSDDFRYFGDRGDANYKEAFPAIRECVESLKQGHRRFHAVELREQLVKLQRSIWRRYRRKKIGNPSDVDNSRPCNADRGSGELSGCEQ